jgi:hypothetical protein
MKDDDLTSGVLDATKASRSRMKIGVTSVDVDD